MRRLISSATLFAPALLALGAANAQTTTGSVGCAAITQAAATGAANTVAADNQTIQQPQSVSKLTCLDNFFGATGLNLVTNLLNPQTLLNQVENQICSAIQQEWNALTSRRHLRHHPDRLQSRLRRPRRRALLSEAQLRRRRPAARFLRPRRAAAAGLYINGSGQPPTGYTLPSTPQGTF